VTERCVDVHHHLLPDFYVDAIVSHGYAEVGGRATPEWSPDLSLGVMDRNNIEMAITSISAPATHFGDDRAAQELSRRCNEFSAELVRTHPSRFGSFATLPMPFVEGAVEEAVYALDTLKADGLVLLSSNNDGSYLGDPRFDPLMAAVNERDAVVFVHPAIPVIADQIDVKIPAFAMEFTFDTTRAIFNLVFNGTLERYPSIKWVAAHAGGTVPYLVERFALLWFTDEELAARAPWGARHYLSQLYYDTALSANKIAYASLSQLASDDRILFGSDFPFAPELMTTASVTAVDSQMELSSDTRHRVRRGNALQLLPGAAERLVG
jgi:predicted TIM-barrel fold metal-dependent hydrolase